MEKHERSIAALVPRKSGTLSTFRGGEKGSHVGTMLQKRRLLASQKQNRGGGIRGGVIQAFWKSVKGVSTLTGRLRYRSVQSKPAYVLRRKLEC